MAFIQIDGDGGGGGWRPPYDRYTLLFYGPTLLRNFIDAHLENRLPNFSEVFPRIGDEEVVDSFDPQNHPLPAGCAHVVVSRNIGPCLPYNVAAVFSYGSVFANASIACTIVHNALPDYTAEQVAKAFRRSAFYLRSGSNKISPLISEVIGVFGEAKKARPVLWERPNRASLFPGF